MNVIILESHRYGDGRILRHIRYLLDSSVRVSHLHFNQVDEPLMPGLFNYCGERGFRINFKSNYKNKIRTLDYLIYSLSKKIVEDGLLALQALDVDPTCPTIIHVHDPILLHLASKLVKIKYKKAKIVYDRHENFEKFQKYYGVNIFLNYEKIFGKSVSGVAIVSESYKKDAERVFPHAAVFNVPNFPRKNDFDSIIIENKANSFNQDSKLNFVYVGGLNNNYDRDVDLMLRIAGEVLDRYENVGFIVGGRDCPQNLEKKFHDYSRRYPGRFEYLGVVPPEKTIEITERAHIGFLLIKPHCDYWVVTSPNKVFEYLICGVVPFIRANIDYAEEIGKSSIIFGRDASEDEILHGMLQLIDDRKKIQNFMRKSRDLSEKFIWESVACRYIEFYKSVLGI